MDRKRAHAAGTDSPRSSQVRAQYDALKRQHPGRVLLFQLGDFYETFEADARIVARVCDITLTSRELSRGDRVDLAGVPVHRAAPHIGKLVAAGYHVAICDQVSEPGKGLVERQVTRVVTPGTVAEPGLISPHENNLIMALAPGRAGIGLAAADVTTGELMTTAIEGGGPRYGRGGRENGEPDEMTALLVSELQRLAPAECLVAEGAGLGLTLPGHTTVLPASRFDVGAASDTLRRLFGVSALDGFGLPADSPALAALGALVSYVGEANHRLLASLREPRPYVVGSHLALDPTTRRNLELTRTARHGHARGSLFHAVDRTRTPMGARRLRRLLGQPLVDRSALEARLDAVEVLVSDAQARGSLRATLSRVGDLERLIGRARQTTATPREIATLAEALRLLPSLQDALGRLDSSQTGHAGDQPGLLQGLAAAIDGCPALADAIEQALAEPGGPRVIRPGYSAELDELVAGTTDSRKWLAQLEGRERERTGIRSLRVGYNRVFGYYLEVTRPNLPSVPANYQRRQSLVSAERFVTPELKEREALILTAEARIAELEAELFQALLRKIGEQARPILRSIDAIAALDVLAALADVAADRRWCRPSFADDDELSIAGGRHPVLEAMLPGGELMPNDCRLGGTPTGGAGRLLIVTGPNMGGKSTYLRMVALTVLLAQIGSFVPAQAARIGLADRLFTRVGSEDDLAAGASTFLVEMAETASILRQATARSLVVLDEVGRGTSTHDGLCIAQAVLEHLHDAISARTLFATHFHELTALADTLPAARNVTVAVDERDGQLAFLYRVVPGAADRSYGVQVARLAGLLGEVTERAAALLHERERGDGWLPDPGPVALGPLDASPGRPHPPTPGRPHPPAPSPEECPHPPAPSPWRGRGGADGAVPSIVERRPATDDGSRRPHGAPPPFQYLNGEGDSSDAGRLPLSRARERGPGGEGTPPERGLGGEGVREPGGEGTPPERGPGGEGDVAATLLAEILALDLGNLTPIRALTLLHELQSAAREAVPWTSWMAEIASTRDPSERR